MNRKGDAYEILWNSLIRLPYLALLFIIFAYMYTNLVDTALDSHRINDQITIKRILYSPNALAYKDEITERVYPGIIDIQKANQPNFEKAFLVGPGNEFAAKVEITTLANSEVRELFINEIWYKRWTPLTTFEQFEKEIFRRPVLIKDKDTYFPGIIKIHIITKNG